MDTTWGSAGWSVCSDWISWFCNFSIQNKQFLSFFSFFFFNPIECTCAQCIHNYEFYCFGPKKKPFLRSLWTECRTFALQRAILSVFFVLLFGLFNQFMQWINSLWPKNFLRQTPSNPEWMNEKSFILNDSNSSLNKGKMQDSVSKWHWLEHTDNQFVKLTHLSGMLLLLSKSRIKNI